MHHWTTTVCPRISVVPWHPRRRRHPLAWAESSIGTCLPPSVVAKGMMLWWSILHHFFDVHAARLQYLRGCPGYLHNAWGSIWHVLFDVAPHAKPVCNPFDSFSPAPNDPAHQVRRTFHLVGSALCEVSWSVSHCGRKRVRCGHVSPRYVRTWHLGMGTVERYGCGLLSLFDFFHCTVVLIRPTFAFHVLFHVFLLHVPVRIHASHPPGQERSCG